MHGDYRVALITRRVCFSPKEEEGDGWLCHNIFHSTYTIGGKICQLVINSGSYENVEAEEVVDKMKLETAQHPNPYKLSWLKKGNEVQISKCYLVTSLLAQNIKIKCGVMLLAWMLVIY